MSGNGNKKIPGIADSIRLMEGLKIISESGARHVIVGGIACNLHGIARGTKDIDLLIPKDVENADKLLRALEGLAWGMSRELFAEDVIQKPFTIIGDMPRVDLLTAAGRLTFDRAYKNRIVRKIAGMNVCYANLDDLIESKKTGRDRDDLDIRELRLLKKK